MQRTTPATGLQPHPQRRSLIRHHLPLLNDPEVVAFLDHQWTHTDGHHALEHKLVRANEPALLLELLRTTGCDELLLDASGDEGADFPPLPDGLFDYFAEHINLAPGVKSLQVSEATLTAATCRQLQVTLNAPGCSIKAMSFANCCFAGAEAQFPTMAPTVEQLHWSDDLNIQPAASIEHCLPALATWKALTHASLLKLGAPLDFAAVARLLLANRNIDSAYLMSDVAPAAPGQPGHLTQHDPAALFDLLRTNRVALTRLTFNVSDTHNPLFNDRCLRCIADCLLTNTTLQTLEVPGITMCTAAARWPFYVALHRNHSLVELGPLDTFDHQPPPSVRRNQHQQFWFTKDFILGAAQALMQAAGAHQDTGALVASHLAPTAGERVYCGAVMGLLCKATHDGAIRLRSAVLREAIKSHLRAGDQPRCTDLLNNMKTFHFPLLPEDHNDVLKFATALGRLTWLPAHPAV